MEACAVSAVQATRESLLPYYGAVGGRRALTGRLAEHERRLVAARAILGEWLAGSGGGWQDSGGLLRSEVEWQGRQEAIRIFDQIVAHLKEGDVRAIGAATHRNFHHTMHMRQLDSVEADERRPSSAQRARIRRVELVETEAKRPVVGCLFIEPAKSAQIQR